MQDGPGPRVKHSTSHANSTVCTSMEHTATSEEGRARSPQYFVNPWGRGAALLCLDNQPATIPQEVSYFVSTKSVTCAKQAFLNPQGSTPPTQPHTIPPQKMRSPQGISQKNFQRFAAKPIPGPMAWYLPQGGGSSKLKRGLVQRKVARVFHGLLGAR